MTWVEEARAALSLADTTRRMARDHHNPRLVGLLRTERERVVMRLAAIDRVIEIYERIN